MAVRKKQFFLPASIGVAAVWFGSHAGAGFATGRQEVEFFVQFGWHSIWIGLFAMLITGTAIYFGLEFARINKIHDYRSLFKKLYEPYNKILPFLFEFIYIYATLLGAAVAISATSHLISGDSHLISGKSNIIYQLQKLHIPYEIGVIFIGLILLVLTVFGAKLVRNASSAMSAFIIIALLIITVLGIDSGWADLGKVVQNRVVKDGIGFEVIIWMALLYGAFQSVLIAPLVSVSENLKTRKQCFKTALYGFLINGIMLLMVCIMLLGYFFKDIQHKALPVDFVTSELSYTWLSDIYALILFLALISTGVGLIFGVIKRFETVWTPHKGVFFSLLLRRIIICMACLIMSAGISFFGLTTIVKIGYGSLGLFALFINVIPLLTVAPLKIRKIIRQGENNKIN